MIYFFSNNNTIVAVEAQETLVKDDLNKLIWLFNNATLLEDKQLEGIFTGPRKEMITPWSTNAVDIVQNMGIHGIARIEEFIKSDTDNPKFDPMLQRVYKSLAQDIFTINKQPDAILPIDDIAAYNQQEGLALSEEEIKYLEELSKQLGRKLTDSEIFGFSQVNSEHCRHKIFNGSFIIDGKEKEKSLFQLIKLTTQTNPNYVVSAYKDNCAFLQGPVIEQFAPERQDVPAYFKTKNFESVLSLKAETHNFPTTVEPFNGAATGTGGEIRDRVAGGKASLPLAGTAVYMTSYPRLEKGRNWEQNIKERNWLYQTPQQILTKASNGASDFGNKFGQPLICGSLLTFEHTENNKNFGFDKVIMLAGGVGFGKKVDVEKGHPEKGDKIVLLGGDNYRIGMGGGAVSSVATGEFNNAIELNAVQRSNPEMQKRVTNAIRAMAESDDNPIISIHDHGAGGHLNCLSELVEETGGQINIDKLPIGDPTLSAKEIVGNESQERIGLVIKEKDAETLKLIAKRERAPMYIIGDCTGDMQFTFVNNKSGEKPIDLSLESFFGNPPKTILYDEEKNIRYTTVEFVNEKIEEYLGNVLQLEGVACKDWLTNKVDRSVTGKVAKQQTCGEIQLPLNNVAVMALDYTSNKGMATSIGHAPVSSLVNPEHGSVLSIAESLTNILWAPLQHGLKGISLSANWMWPAKNEGENNRLYKAVEAASKFAIELGINIPTGKDSLSMTQKYPDGTTVFSPGTVIISAMGEVSDITKVVEPVVRNSENTAIYYIDLSKDSFKLGGSSLAQTLNKLGSEAPTIADSQYFIKCFNTIQELISDKKIIAGHDISSGGMITTLLEMLFSGKNIGLDIDLNSIQEKDIVKVLFAENPGIIIQAKTEIASILKEKNITFHEIGKITASDKLEIKFSNQFLNLDIEKYRDIWFKTSYLLEKHQTNEPLAEERYKNYKNQSLSFKFPTHFTGDPESMQISMNRDKKSGIKAAIIREKGVNGDREMAYSMHLAGLDVKDVHMTDLIEGRETLEDVNMIVFVGGFSNSDVLGSAKGWAGAFLYNPKAKLALDKFYARKDTLSLGVCNGCQLMVELGLIYPDMKEQPKMLHNASGKFESAFLNVEIAENNSVMLKTLAGSRLGIWVAHGEGRFQLAQSENTYHIPMKYTYSQYPGNPNGSDYSTAAIVSKDGRHLAMMPHLERAIFPWNWANYPESRKETDKVTPWIEAFVNAREWIKQNV